MPLSELFEPPAACLSGETQSPDGCRDENSSGRGEASRGEGSLPPMLRQTLNRMIQEQIPNFLRLYPNPWVARTCLALSRMVATLWPGTRADGEFGVFLANSGDEALSGAIKLGRFAQRRARLRRGHAPADDWIIDPAGDLEHFAESRLNGSQRIEYIPGLRRAETARACAATHADAGPRVLALTWPAITRLETREMERVRRDTLGGKCFLILCVEREGWIRARADTEAAFRRLRPDAVVFDESFTCREVPFGAFAARPEIYRLWMTRGMSAFHSTTFQPNTISTLHFISCLRDWDPALAESLQGEFDRLEREPAFLCGVYRRLFSPQLAGLFRIAGTDRAPMRAWGHRFHVGGRAFFDAVAGVACSLRGHNPPNYMRQLQDSPGRDACRDFVAGWLERETGLPFHLPAVSGAGAVEQALKLGLCARHPRARVLALRGGFGGKTLFALTGTARPFYKQGLDPLYADVVYIDPFAADAVARIEEALREAPVAVVQIELIQGVGGVRALPAAVLQCLQERRQTDGFLLLVDEIQTGMFRTGPFVRSRTCGLQPDLMTLGKAVSDMMFPFGFTLYSKEVHEVMMTRNPTLLERCHRLHGFETGYQTARLALSHAEVAGMAERVRTAGRAFEFQLHRHLGSCPRVRETRVFGLLIGIELDLRRWPERWLGKTGARLHLARLLRNPRKPLLAGFCQYEPHVLKLTPPLSIEDHEIDEICAILAESLHTPFLHGLVRWWPGGRFLKPRP